MKTLVLAAASLVATTAIGVAPAQARHHGWHMKRVCHTTWVHHHKVTRCRNVRVRW